MNTPEDLFKNKFSGFEKSPSDKVWKKIERQLTIQKFLKFNPKTFNIWYLAASCLVAGIGLAHFVNQENETQEYNAKTFVSSSYDYTASKRKVVVLKPSTENKQSTKTSQNKDITDNADKTLISEGRTEKISQKYFLDSTQNAETSKTTIAQTQHTESKDFTSYFEMSAHSGCAPFSVEFKNLSKNTEYCYWNFGNGDVSYDQDSKVVYLEPGQYYVTLKTVNGVFSKIYTDTVQVFAQPQAQVSYVVSSKTLIAEAKNAKASAFVWNFGDGIKAVGEKTTHAYSDYGVYHLALTISNNICADTIETDINILPQQYNIKFPNALTVSASGPQGSGISRNQNYVTSFYPRGDVNMLSKYTLKILNRNRKEVFSTDDPRHGWDGYYRGERLPKGVYVYVCQYEFAGGEHGNLTGNITLIWE